MKVIALRDFRDITPLGTDRYYTSGKVYDMDAAHWWLEAGLVAPVEPPRQIDATDAAQRLADEHGVNLAALTGSGVDGRILKADVEAAL